jgi:methyl coenzyme M reductase alpha subunit
VVALIAAEKMMTDVAKDLTHGVGVHSRRQVGTYRARIVDRAGRLMRPTVVFEAPGDATAIARARALAGDGEKIEVWDRTRRVDQINLASGPAASNPPGIHLRMKD